LTLGLAAAGPAAADVPRCTVAEATLITRIASATATAGDSFTFKLAEHVRAERNLPDIPAGTRGYGVVAYADHAHGAGQAGRLIVEPRYLALADGTHVQVMADPQLAESVVEGSSRDLNGALSFVPGIGIAVTGYNALHRGKEVTLAPGTQFRIVIGDELATAECFVPSPSSPDIR
jgi:hypothetical protein